MHFDETESEALQLHDRVRLRGAFDTLAAGTEGEVVGFYHGDAPRVLVRFEQHAALPVPAELVERLGQAREM